VGLTGILLSPVAMILAPTPALAASTFGDHLWSFVNASYTLTVNEINLNKGGSRIYDAGNLTLETDDVLYLNVPTKVISRSAVQAPSFWGDGSHLTGVTATPVVGTTSSAITDDKKTDCTSSGVGTMIISTADATKSKAYICMTATNNTPATGLFWVKMAG
jgi:hypothetical protein